MLVAEGRGWVCVAARGDAIDRGGECVNGSGRRATAQ
eukprot:gene35516-7165_t